MFVATGSVRASAVKHSNEPYLIWAMGKEGSGAINQLSIARTLSTQNTLPTMRTYKYLALLPLLLSSIFSISTASAASVEKADFCSIPRGFPCGGNGDCCPGHKCISQVSRMDLSSEPLTFIKI